jgi:hypothetical protein
MTKNDAQYALSDGKRQARCFDPRHPETRPIYIRYSYIDERKAALEALGEHVGENVVNIEESWRA